LKSWGMGRATPATCAIALRGIEHVVFGHG